MVALKEGHTHLSKRRDHQKRKHRVNTKRREHNKKGGTTKRVATHGSTRSWALDLRPPVLSPPRPPQMPRRRPPPAALGAAAPPMGRATRGSRDSRLARGEELLLSLGSFAGKGQVGSSLLELVPPCCLVVKGNPLQNQSLFTGSSQKVMFMGEL